MICMPLIPFDAQIYCYKIINCRSINQMRTLLELICKRRKTLNGEFSEDYICNTTRTDTVNDRVRVSYSKSVWRLQLSLFVLLNRVHVAEPSSSSNTEYSVQVQDLSETWKPENVFHIYFADDLYTFDSFRRSNLLL